MSATRRARSGSALIPRACIAVDWCGAIADARKRMWLAEARASGQAAAGTASAACRSSEPGAHFPAPTFAPSSLLHDPESRPPGVARARCGTDAVRRGGSGSARAGARDRLPSSRSAGTIVRLECGRDRDEMVAHLIECARREPRLVVGLDFAFSFPRWFLEARGIDSARAGWELAAREGETWLAHCPRPFWGRPGVRRPKLGPDKSEWRTTEGESVRVRGVGPKSVFQVGGAGSVGTGSLRGMPHLIALRDAGFSIWPFDAPRLPMVVEIYPRYLTGAVNKSSRVARALYIQAHHADERRDVQDLAGSSEDAFDAAVSAAVMLRARSEFARLERDRSDTTVESLEGRIWTPLRDPMFASWPMFADRPVFAA